MSEINKLINGNFWKIIYNDGDKIRAIKSKIIGDDNNFLHFDTRIKEIFLPKKFLVMIESIEKNKEQENKNMGLRRYRLSVVGERNKEIYLVGYFENGMDLIRWVSGNYKELFKE